VSSSPRSVVPLLARFLGPLSPPVAPDAQVLETTDCGGYLRHKVNYAVAPDERVSAYLCVPKDVRVPAPAVFCHHQHAGEFGLGKSEVVGLAGDPDQAYASELAALGFVTIAPDALGFEERNWSPGGRENITWFELSTRLVRGETLLGKCLSDLGAALDVLEQRPEVDSRRIGFLGHSYGGKMAFWATAFDARIKAAVSHCGCIPYRLAATRDAGIQAEFVVPGFAAHHDLEDLIDTFQGRPVLISATRRDRWSRGAQELYDEVRARNLTGVELALYDEAHVFTHEMRQRAYAFLSEHLNAEPISGSTA
jgi:dienelactone hydrolase